jgi:hypothetical protein
VTVTPNVRALHSHLETFYQHFGHVTFYHPRLLAFFADHVGFERSEEGENPRLAAPLFGPGSLSEGTGPSVVGGGGPTGSATAGPPRPGSSPSGARRGVRPPRYEPDLPKPTWPLGGLWWRVKMCLARLVVRPYLDPLVADLHGVLADLDAERARLTAAMEELEAGSEGTQARLEEVIARLDRSYEAYVVSWKGDHGPTAAGGGPAATPGSPS